MKILKYLGIFLLILIVLLGLAALGIYSTIVSKQKIEDGSVLELSFSETPGELQIEPSPVQKLLLGESPPPTLIECLELIQSAAKDPKIYGISINGASNLRHVASMELHQALVKFKESGKPIYAYADYYTQGGYVIASLADSIFLDPMGSIDLKGYAIILSYFKDFLERSDIEMEIYSAGKFKSFVESYNRESASPENRMQYEQYLYGLQDELIRTLAKSREISTEKLQQVIDENLAFEAEDCIALRLADVLSYKTDYEEFLEKRFGKDESPVVKISRYKSSRDFFADNSKVNAALVVIDGEIRDNEGVASTDKMRKAFSEIRDNEDIDLVVLRVNSPGGSATASDRIWHEVELTKAAGKEVIASVSSVAGSGGYYVMAGADKIYAAPGSLTGSIGVFIVFPVVEKALSENIGIDFDAITTGPHATRFNSLQELTEPQKANLRQSTDKLYDLFVKRVADGRQMDSEDVYEIAQGRVYSGTDATSVKLIDDTIYLVDLLDSIGRKGEKLVFSAYPKIKKEWSDFANLDFMFKLKGLDAGTSAVVKSHLDQLGTLLERPKVMMRMECGELSY